MAYLDSRELAKRLDELEAQADDEDDAPLDADELEELEELRELADTVTDWQYGATFIPCDDFEQYARELADDIGAIPSDIGWPASCIDWQRAADELAQDYSEVSYQGADYYVRD